MKASYIAHSGDDLLVVNAARVSMAKESEWKEVGCAEEVDVDSRTITHTPVLDLHDKDVKLINYLAKHQHMTPFEHCFLTLHLKVPIFIARQIHRHRTFSYNEVSRRYVKDNLEFYWPEKWRKQAENVKQGSSDEEVEVPPSFVESRVMVLIDCYEQLLEGEICAEQARMILPQNLYTEFYMSGNLRNWAHFLKLRLDSHAQKEVQEVAKQVATIAQQYFPHSYKALMEN